MINKEDEKINVWGARVHNLKNIDVEIPRNSLTVFTGLSGSGKSSLAFDTIYAEGQRRYLETFSAYARNFLGNMERPDVDKITGLSPVISIEQKTTNRNPRSTVGTTTEIYDFIRLLYARAGKAYSYVSGEEMVKYTEEMVVQMISERYAGHRIYIMAPQVRSRKGHYRELFDSLRRKGFLYVRVDGELRELEEGMRVDRYKNHDIEVVVDRMQVEAPLNPPLRGETDDPDNLSPLRGGAGGGLGGGLERLCKSVDLAMRMGDGLMFIYDKDTDEVKHYSKRLMCPTTGMAYADPQPNTFSFNSPQGACPRCKGLGIVNEIDIDKVIPDKRMSIHGGAIVPLGKYKPQMIFYQIDSILHNYGLDIKAQVADIPEKALNEILYGTIEEVRVDAEVLHISSDYFRPYDGVIKYLRDVMEADESAAAQKWVEQFMAECVCPDCGGKRLSREALSYRLWNKNIAELSDMDLGELAQWIDEVEEHLDTRQKQIAVEILKEVRTRIRFLLDVGLDYLSLSRRTASLSGGESQRIRLATQIGSQLVNVLYILDEPSIGLHQRDNERLIKSLCQLRDIGNTVIVVEHDRDMMLAADYIVDIGPKAGRKGGEVVFQGTPKEMLAPLNPPLRGELTITAQYLKAPLTPPLRGETDAPVNHSPLRGGAGGGLRRSGNGKTITIRGARGNNLKNVDVSFPLGTLIVVTGVSGSGKSTLINETLQPILSHRFYRSLKSPMPYDSIEGVENIDKIVDVDQTPLGRTPRSNPATYTGVFSDIRALFVNLPEAKIRGYKPGRFSFNVRGGRCEECGGNGYKNIEMNFLPDVLVPCEVCHGKRYNRETLEVRYKGKSIADILDMTINQAVEFFQNVPEILRKIKTIQDVGLGYIKLGQPSTTLSGGESQRVKLATELSKKDTGNTLYILDEPTTGLHFEDIRILMDVLQSLVDKGNTVLIIEHNTDVIRLADHIIDMGPEGGRNGGTVVATGTPEEIKRKGKGYTAKYI